MTEWPVKTLGEVCDGVQRLDPAKSNSEVFTYIDLSAIDQKSKSVSGARVISVKEAPGRARQLVRKHDVLVSTVRPNLNAVALIGDSLDGAVASTGFCVLRPIKNIIDSRLVFAWIRSQRFIDELSSMATGASYPAVTDNVVKGLEIPVPPLGEQKRIVALLDAANAHVTELTACYEQARTHANNLFASAMRDALESNPDWPVTTLDDICELISRGRPPSYCEFGGVVVLNQKCVRNGKIDLGPSRRTDNLLKAVPEWAYLQEGDTLINSTGAGTLGRASFVAQLNEPTTFDTHLTVVRPLSAVCWPPFVGLVLNGREKDIVDLAGGATGQTELPRESVRSFEIPVPPLEEQKRIVARLDAMRTKTSEMVVAYDAKLQAAKDLRQSILEAAFAGDL